MLMQFKLVGGGSYVNNGKTYRTGDTVISKTDLEKKHNTPTSMKFQRVMPDLPDESVNETQTLVVELPPSAIELAPGYGTSGPIVSEVSGSEAKGTDSANSDPVPQRAKKR